MDDIGTFFEQRKGSLMTLSEKTLTCRQRALSFFNSLTHRTEDKWFWRHSRLHDVNAYPDHLLYGTWSGLAGTVLLGGHANWTPVEREKVGAALNCFQQTDGAFMLPGAIAHRRNPRHDENYLRYHFTNYALGALRLIGVQPERPLRFVEDLKTKSALDNWLQERDWSQPWLEGNNVVNLGSFLALLSEDGCSWARERLDDLVDWHDKHQNSSTGLWHCSPANSREGLLNALAGAAHNLHLYYYLGREVPRPKEVIDSCLRPGYLGIRSACIDIDMVDSLVNLRRADYRLEEIDSYLTRYLIELLQVQNADGGFGDDYVQPICTYGLITPANASVAWTSWFRLVAIGMAACALLPSERHNWTFRNTIGMGYCNLDYALVENRCTSYGLHTGHHSNLDSFRLAATRQLRVARQRITHRVRQYSGSVWQRNR